MSNEIPQRVLKAHKLRMGGMTWPAVAKAVDGIVEPIKAKSFQTSMARSFSQCGLEKPKSKAGRTKKSPAQYLSLITHGESLLATVTDCWMSAAETAVESGDAPGDEYTVLLVWQFPVEGEAQSACEHLTSELQRAGRLCSDGWWQETSMHDPSDPAFKVWLDLMSKWKDSMVASNINPIDFGWRNRLESEK